MTEHISMVKLRVYNFNHDQQRLKIHLNELCEHNKSTIIINECNKSLLSPGGGLSGRLE